MTEKHTESIESLPISLIYVRHCWIAGWLDLLFIGGMFGLLKYPFFHFLLGGLCFGLSILYLYDALCDAVKKGRWKWGVTALIWIYTGVRVMTAFQ